MKHDQKGYSPDDKSSSFVCTNCLNKQCGKCVDVMRTVYTDVMICKCKEPKHGGEPVDRQVRDPFTGTVHAPHLTVSEGGVVTRTDGDDQAQPS